MIELGHFQLDLAMRALLFNGEVVHLPPVSD